MTTKPNIKTLVAAAAFALLTMACGGSAGTAPAAAVAGTTVERADSSSDPATSLDDCRPTKSVYAC